MILTAVLLWYAGVGVVLVWLVFRDPAIDYRLVIGGALLPDAVDVFAGRAFVMHTLAASVSLLVIVMLATRRRRAARRRYLAVPVGTFSHLLLDAVWARTQLFWWPAFGAGFEARALPSASRPWPVLLMLELAGATSAVWFWRRFRLSEPARREVFLRTGRLGRDFRPGRPPASDDAA